MKVKLLSVVGLAASGSGVIVGVVGILIDRPRVLQWGLVASLAGVTALLAAVVWMLRREGWAVAQVRKSVGRLEKATKPGLDPKASEALRRLVREEVDEVIRVLDGRVIGLFEMLSRSEPSHSRGRDGVEG